MEHAEKLIQPCWVNKRLVHRFVRGHDEAILYEADHESRQREDPPRWIMLHAPERCCEQRVSAADVREAVSIALLLAKRRNLLAQINIALERSSHA